MEQHELFPVEWNFKTSNPMVRESIYKAFGGKCFYTGREVAFEDMEIDHIWPRVKEGPDNLFNYVCCDADFNNRKNDKFDEAIFQRFYDAVAIAYRPSVLKRFKALVRKKEEYSSSRKKYYRILMSDREQSVINAIVNKGIVQIHKPKFIIKYSGLKRTAWDSLRKSNEKFCGDIVGHSDGRLVEYSFTGKDKHRNKKSGRLAVVPEMAENKIIGLMLKNYGFQVNTIIPRNCRISLDIE